MTGLHGVVADHWRALAGSADPPTSGVNVSQLPVAAAQGRLLAGVDAAGRRHLLVPVAPTRTVVTDTRSAGVHLLGRSLRDGDDDRLFADLVLLDPALEDVFTSLCADVLVAVESDPERPVRALKVVLDAWRSLLDFARPTFGSGAATGLLGELLVLNRLLDLDPGAARAWTGPFGTAQDFHRGGAAIEVKTTAATEGRRIRVHGLDQLDHGVGPLWIAWIRVERRTDTGTSLADLAAEVRARADDAGVVVAALHRLGFEPNDPYVQAVRFNVIEERWHLVDTAFPRLTPASFGAPGVPVGVADVHYTVDLDAVGATTSPEAVLRAFLEAT